MDGDGVELIDDRVVVTAAAGHDESVGSLTVARWKDAEAAAWLRSVVASKTVSAALLEHGGYPAVVQLLTNQHLSYGTRGLAAFVLGQAATSDPGAKRAARAQHDKVLASLLQLIRTAHDGTSLETASVHLSCFVALAQLVDDTAAPSGGLSSSITGKAPRRSRMAMATAYSKAVATYSAGNPALAGPRLKPPPPPSAPPPDTQITKPKLQPIDTVGASMLASQSLESDSAGRPHSRGNPVLPPLGSPPIHGRGTHKPPPPPGTPPPAARSAAFAVNAYGEQAHVLDAMPKATAWRRGANVLIAEEQPGKYFDSKHLGYQMNVLWYPKHVNFIQREFEADVQRKRDIRTRLIARMNDDDTPAQPSSAADSPDGTPRSESTLHVPKDHAVSFHPSIPPGRSHSVVAETSSQLDGPPDSRAATPDASLWEAYSQVRVPETAGLPGRARNRGFGGNVILINPAARPHGAKRKAKRQRPVQAGPGQGLIGFSDSESDEDDRFADDASTLSGFNSAAAAASSHDNLPEDMASFHGYVRDRRWSSGHAGDLTGIPEDHSAAFGEPQSVSDGEGSVVSDDGGVAAYTYRSRFDHLPGGTDRLTSPSGQLRDDPAVSLHAQSRKIQMRHHRRQLRATARRAAAAGLFIDTEPGLRPRSASPPRSKQAWNGPPPQVVAALQAAESQPRQKRSGLQRLAESPYASSAMPAGTGTWLFVPGLIMRPAMHPTLPANYRFGSTTFVIPGVANLRGYTPMDGLYREVVPSVNKLRTELRKLRKEMQQIDEASLAECMRLMRTLPLPFLLAQGGIYADYVRQRCIRALKMLFAGVWESTAAAAMAKWKRFVAMSRAVEARRMYRFTQGRRRIRETMKNYFNRLAHQDLAWAWSQWATLTRAIRDAERAAAVNTIQRSVRCWLSRTRLLRLKRDFALRAAAAVPIQTAFRGYRARRWFKRWPPAAVTVSAWWRGTRVRLKGSFKFFRGRAVRIQAAVRRHQQFVRFRRLKAATLVVQNVWRCCKTRRIFEIMTMAVRMNEELRWTGAMELQRLWRGHQARKQAQAIKDHELALNLAALRVQLSWYRRNNQFTAFILLRCLVVHHQYDVERTRDAHAAMRAARATLLQKIWRGMHARRRVKLVAFRRWAVVRIQSWIRGSIVRKHIDAIRAAQREMARRHRAAFLIQRTWWAAKPGRLLWHLKWRNARKQEWYHLRRMLRWIPAARRIQRALRQALARRLIWRHRCALRIQAQYRRVLAARRVRILRDKVRRMLARDVWYSAFACGRVVAVRHHQVRQRNAATKINTHVRGMVCRRRYVRLVRQDRACRVIQKAWSAWKALRLQRVVAIKLRRVRGNPYRLLEDPLLVTRQGVMHASQLWDPWNRDSGLLVSEILRRFNMSHHATLLSNAGYKTQADFVNLDASKLVAAGVTVDAEVQQMMSLVHAMRLGLAAGIKYQPLVGDSFVKSYVNADMLTLAELQNVAADSANFRAALAATTDPTAAVTKRAHLVPTPAITAAAERFTEASESVAKDLFLKFLPGNTSRAEFAASKIAAADRPVSVGQITAFLKRYPSPQEAKQHMPELVTVPPQTLAAEQSWEEKRVRLALRSLLHAAEQIGELRGFGVEERLLRGPDRRKQAAWEFELPQLAVGKAVGALMRLVDDKRRERWRARVRKLRQQAVARKTERQRRAAKYLRQKQDMQAEAERVQREAEREEREAKRRERQLAEESAKQVAAAAEARQQVQQQAGAGRGVGRGAGRGAPPPTGRGGPQGVAVGPAAVGRGRGRGRGAGRGVGGVAPQQQPPPPPPRPPAEKPPPPPRPAASAGDSGSTPTAAGPTAAAAAAAAAPAEIFCGVELPEELVHNMTAEIEAEVEQLRQRTGGTGLEWEAEIQALVEAVRDQLKAEEEEKAANRLEADKADELGLLPENLPSLEDARQYVITLRHALKKFAVAEAAARVMQRAWRSRIARAILSKLRRERKLLELGRKYKQERAAKAAQNARSTWDTENKKMAEDWARYQREMVVYQRQQDMENARLATTLFGWQELWTAPSDADPYGTPYYYNKITGESLWERPLYAWETTQPTVRIQAIMRMKLGRLAAHKERRKLAKAAKLALEEQAWYSAASRHGRQQLLQLELRIVAERAEDDSDAESTVSSASDGYAPDVGPDESTPGAEDADAVSVASKRSRVASLASPRITWGVEVRLLYTKSAMPFDWIKVQDGSGSEYYYNQRTGETAWEQPEYSFREMVAARLFQAAWRGLKGRRSYVLERDRMAAQQLGVDLKQAKTPVGTANAVVEVGTKMAWVGYEDEGMTLSQWLTRAGCLATLRSLQAGDAKFQAARNEKSKKKAAAATKGKSGAKGKGGAKAGGATRVVTTNEDGEKEIILPLQGNGSLTLNTSIEELKRMDDGALTAAGVTPPERVKILELIAGKARAISNFELVWSEQEGVQVWNAMYPAMAGRGLTFGEAVASLEKPVSVGNLRAYLMKWKAKPKHAVEELPKGVGRLDTFPSSRSIRSVLTLYDKGVSHMIKLLEDWGLRRISGYCKAHLNRTLRDMEANLELHREQRKGAGGAKVDVRRVHFDAALRLRKIFAAIQRLDHATKILQAHGKRRVARRSYQAWLLQRKNAAVTIQRIARGVLARALANQTRDIRAADWEQCWDPNTDAYFYFHVPSGRSQWYAPSEPFRPAGWWQPPQPLEKGTCAVCRTEKATRQCNTCFWDEWEEFVRVDAYKGYGTEVYHDSVRYRPKEYCFSCFALEHRTSRALRSHTFTLLEEHKPKPLVCAECGNPAGAYCFTCEEHYCGDCWHSLHAKGRKRYHKWKRFNPDSPVCVECERFVATKTCNHCEDSYCDECVTKTHSKGKKRQHTFTKIQDPLYEGWKHCQHCDVNLGTEVCPTCSKVFCDACHMQYHQVCDVAEKAAAEPTAVVQEKCCQCGEPASRVCEQCDLSYCNRGVFSGTGCFETTHQIGNRVTHVVKDHPRLKLIKSAIVVQRHIRGRNARRLLKAMLRRRRVDAARVIQKFWKKAKANNFGRPTGALAGMLWNIKRQVDRQTVKSKAAPGKGSSGPAAPAPAPAPALAPTAARTAKARPNKQ